ncbi:MAG: TolC family protein [Pseudomonadota bacterium]
MKVAKPIVLLAGLLVCPWLSAAPLPQPLSLTDALRLAGDESHYDLQLHLADLDAARAALRGAQGERDFTLGIEARARYIDPPKTTSDPGHDDHAAVLVARKRLFDFGRGSALEEAARAVIDGEERRLGLAREQRKLDVMRAFYDVLLADMSFTVANERMAIVYVDYDKVKDKHELGQLSQVDLLRVQTSYEEALRDRNVAEARQRNARVRLAAALGDASRLPAKLSEPALDGLASRKAPEIDAAVKDALERNPALIALRRQLEASIRRIEAARARRLPVIDAVVEGGAYAREMGTNDPFRAGLVLSAPLVVSGMVEGEIVRAEAERRRAEAQLARAEAELRQRLTELVLDIDVLRKSATGDKVRGDYREIYLERSRALYEMEVSTDLGDSMVQVSDARLRALRTLYALSLAWAELDALSGRPVESLAKPETPVQGAAP